MVVDARMHARHMSEETNLRAARRACPNQMKKVRQLPLVGEVNATFVSLIASCQLHGIEPWAYLRDLFCLLPSWPQRRVLDLSPAFWKKTLEEIPREAAGAWIQRTIRRSSSSALSPMFRRPSGTGNWRAEGRGMIPRNWFSSATQPIAGAEPLAIGWLDDKVR